jgi:hypothetical protein
MPGHHGHHVGAVEQPRPGGRLTGVGIDLRDMECRLAEHGRRLAGAGADHDRGDAADLEVGGVPEDDQQDDGHGDHHRHRPPVPAQLAELLGDHRPHDRPS